MNLIEWQQIIIVGRVPWGSKIFNLPILALKAGYPSGSTRST